MSDEVAPFIREGIVEVRSDDSIDASSLHVDSNIGVGREEPKVFVVSDFDALLVVVESAVDEAEAGANFHSWAKIGEEYCIA